MMLKLVCLVSLLFATTDARTFTSMRRGAGAVRSRLGPRGQADQGVNEPAAKVGPSTPKAALKSARRLSKATKQPPVPTGASELGVVLGGDGLPLSSKYDTGANPLGNDGLPVARTFCNGTPKLGGDGLPVARHYDASQAGADGLPTTRTGVWRKADLRKAAL